MQVNYYVNYFKHTCITVEFLLRRNSFSMHLYHKKKNLKEPKQGQQSHLSVVDILVLHHPNKAICITSQHLKTASKRRADFTTNGPARPGRCGSSTHSQKTNVKRQYLSYPCFIGESQRGPMVQKHHGALL